MHWPDRSFPLSPRSNGTFSPDSSDGLEIDCANNNSGAGTTGAANYYTRSQSEEHILLSPCRDGPRSPNPTSPPGGSAAAVARNATPDLLLMTTSLYAGVGCGGGGDGAYPASPRLLPPGGGSSSFRPGSSGQQQQLHHQKIRRNHTLNLSTDFLGMGSVGGGGGDAAPPPPGALSPFRNQMSYECTYVTNVFIVHRMRFTNKSLGSQMSEGH